MSRGPFELRIADFLESKPFVPFAITLTSGDRFVVPGRHKLAMGEGRFIAVPDAGGSRWFSEAQIASVEISKGK